MNLITLQEILAKYIPNVFPKWHASSIADLFKPAIYENNRNDKGYWF